MPSGRGVARPIWLMFAVQSMIVLRAGEGLDPFRPIFMVKGVSGTPQKRGSEG